MAGPARCDALQARWLAGKPPAAGTLGQLTQFLTALAEKCHQRAISPVPLPPRQTEPAVRAPAALDGTQIRWRRARRARQPRQRRYGRFARRDALARRAAARTFRRAMYGPGRPTDEPYGSQENRCDPRLARAVRQARDRAR